MCWQRTPAAAGYRRRHVHLEARRVAPEVLGEGVALSSISGTGVRIILRVGRSCSAVPSR